jgi:FkbM family methyltransferase
MNILKFLKKNYTEIIYDVGMHIGEDTDFYLKKGFKVIAIEANPLLVKQCEEKFASYIKNKQLVILNLGIAKEKGRFTFYVNDFLTEWSSFDKEIGTREGKYHEIEVQCVNMKEILSKYGIPYYLKIDIEGYDFIALEPIKEFKTKPKYVSVENGGKNFLNFFQSQGYSRYKFINQKYVTEQKPPFPATEGKYIDFKFPWGSSGLFGEETSGEWKNYDDILQEMDAYWGNPNRDANIDGWYDLHAKLY